MIVNLGGEVAINNASFEYNFISSDEEEQEYSAIVWVEPEDGFFATTTITNSVFAGGYTAIRDESPASYLEITSSTFRNFTNSNGVIRTENTLPALANNTFEANEKDAVYIEALYIDTDTTLNAEAEYIVYGIEIDETATLTLDPGVILSLGNNANITVDGILQAVGTAEERITIQTLDEDGYWGNLIFNNTTSTFEYVDISAGNHGYSIASPYDNGMLVLNHSNLTLDNVSLTDARRPYNMVYGEYSSFSISNSVVSWDAPKQLKNWTIIGLNFKNSGLYINNTTFNQMDYAIQGSGASIAEMENMTPEHFTNISGANWWPGNLLEF